MTVILVKVSQLWCIVLFLQSLSIPSTLDCHLYAVSWWKPALVPEPVSVEPDRWACYWVRAAKDPYSTGQLPGWHVYSHALWGKRFDVTTKGLILSLGYSLDSADEALFHTHSFICSKKSDTGSNSDGTHKNTSHHLWEYNFEFSFTRNLNICWAKPLCSKDLQNVVFGFVCRLVGLHKLMKYNSEIPQ